MEFNNFKFDSDKEVNGAWVDISPTSRIKVARIGSEHFKEVFQRRLKPYANVLRFGSLPKAEERMVLIETLAECVLLDWDGFTENGEICPYSKEKARQILIENEGFRDVVSNVAQDFENFREIGIEADSKN